LALADRIGVKPPHFPASGSISIVRHDTGTF
jgi:hypothetical protein